MGWSDLALSGVKNFGGFVAGFIDAQNKRKWQKYNNTMVHLQAAQNQNTLTDNENMARERSQEEAFLIRRSEYVTKASAEVAAAATGTTGRSVNMILFDVGRNAALADRDRARDLKLQYLGIDNSRRNVALQEKLSLDLTDIPNPNPFTSILGFAADASKLKEEGLGIRAVERNTGPRDPWEQNGVSMRL